MDLIIVGDSTDRLSLEVSRVAEENGFKSAILDVYRAAQIFSISVSSGRAIITPDIPLFLRVLAPSILRENFDESFHYDECFSTLWAVASSCKSAVINRPSVYSFAGLATQSSNLTRQRGGMPLHKVEVFSSQVPKLSKSYMNEKWYLQDLGTLAVMEHPTHPEGSGPYRGIYSSSNPAYEIVIVLEDKAWRSTALSLQHLELERQSIDLARRLDLTFAAVTWSIGQDFESASLARIDPFPSMEQVQFVWPALAPELLEFLFS